MTTVLTIVSFVFCCGVAYWLAGWGLAFLVVSQAALISFGALLILACVAMAIASRGDAATRWWVRMILCIIFCVALETLEPYVGVIRVVLAAAGGIWATYLLHRNVIRRIAHH